MKFLGMCHFTSPRSIPLGTAAQGRGAQNRPESRPSPNPIQGWPILQLLVELRREHEVMEVYSRLVPLIREAESLPEENPGSSVVELPQPGNFRRQRRPIRRGAHLRKPDCGFGKPARRPQRPALMKCPSPQPPRVAPNPLRGRNARLYSGRFSLSGGFPAGQVVNRQPRQGDAQPRQGLKGAGSRWCSPKCGDAAQKAHNGGQRGRRAPGNHRVWAWTRRSRKMAATPHGEEDPQHKTNQVGQGVKVPERR